MDDIIKCYYRNILHLRVQMYHFTDIENKSGYNFVSNWFDSLLNSTRPTIECLRIQDIMTKSGIVFEKKLIKTFFRYNSKEFGFDCTSNICSNNSIMNAGNIITKLMQWTRKFKFYLYILK
jgi:hypothetical protein